MKEFDSNDIQNELDDEELKELKDVCGEYSLNFRYMAAMPDTSRRFMKVVAEESPF